MTRETEKLLSDIRKKKNSLIRTGMEISVHDKDKRTRNESKIRYLEEKMHLIQKLSEKNEYSLFISYSAPSRDKYTLAKNLAESLFPFKVVSGFEHDKENSEILPQVLSRIRKASCFLSIMTPNPSLTLTDNKGCCPSIWLAEEKGMALAFGKPFHLLVDRQIHDDFYKRTAPQTIHTIFSDNNFEEKVKE